MLMQLSSVICSSEFTFNPLVFQAAMMSIAFKEGIKNLAPALNEIILASNQDVRQVKEP